MKPLRQTSFDEAQDSSVRAGFKQTEVGVIPEEWEENKAIRVVSRQAIPLN